jgi:UV DNA damage repair endonuclease
MYQNLHDSQYTILQISENEIKYKSISLLFVHVKFMKLPMQVSHFIPIELTK